MSAMRARMRKEIEMLENDPPYGVSAWPKDGLLDRMEAQILGPEHSPYEKGTFLLDIEIPERYPFEPPKVRFLTPIYHPNIDDAGRICLDTLKMQPNGSWLPSVNISTLLTTIRLLMAEPNADDGLMPEITEQFKHNRELFDRKAIESTRLHACNISQPQANVISVVELTQSDRNQSALKRELEQTPEVNCEKQVPTNNSNVLNESHDNDINNKNDDDDSGFSDDDESDHESRPKRQRQ